MWDGLGFVVWEASTPFLNIHWFLDKLGLTGSVFQLVNAVFLLTLYVGVRLIWGVSNSFKYLRETWLSGPLDPPVSPFQHTYLSVACLALNTLNIIWFRAMVAAILKRFNEPAPAIVGPPPPTMHEADFGPESGDELATPEAKEVAAAIADRENKTVMNGTKSK